jgi:HAD superfamily hydrolase (TIGR01549 family)
MALIGSIDWVFFDVGNVLMDESRWLERYHAVIYDGLAEVVPGLTREDFDRAREEGKGQEKTIAQYVVNRYLPDRADLETFRNRHYQSVVDLYYQLGDPAEGAIETLKELARHYRLGIIANQLAPIHGWMERTGLAHYFPLAVYDCEFGCGKPDPRIFHEALRLADCPPERAVMVGDRLDNDIAPAKALGMWTLRVRAFGDYARPEPRHDAETPHATVYNLREVSGVLKTFRQD